MTTSCPVNSHNEWDPLEEVIVGTPNGAMFPSWDQIIKFTLPEGTWEAIMEMVGDLGAPCPQELIDAANAELEEFVHIMEAEGITVRRIDPADYAAAFSTPDWEIPSGFCGANPRDPFLVIGNEIIETPMADRVRYYESWAYRSLFKEYLKGGAKWVAAPKPQLKDELFSPDYSLPQPGEDMRYVITEFEPVFDAADFVRCGRDIFGQKSQVTNEMGILWLQRHLGDAYRVHVVQSKCRYPMHIDTTLMPLAPGKVLVNPEYLDLDEIAKLFKGWDLLKAPPAAPDDSPMGEVGWVNINMFMLDEERVVVEKEEVATIKALKDWGFKPIPCAFRNYYAFAGSFHCATLDVRRRGELKSYF